MSTIYLWLIVALFIYILIKPAAAETLSQSNGTSSSQSIQQVFNNQCRWPKLRRFY